MDQALIKKIIEEKIPCFFISPHLDDAILSCGGLIKYLLNKTQVSVATVFTEASPAPYTLSAKAFLSQCDFNEAGSLFKKRRKEDMILMKRLNIKNIHFHFQDALWRKKIKSGWFKKYLAEFLPEFGHIYPTYRFHAISGRVSGMDRDLLENIKKQLAIIFQNKERFAVFCPLALGNHVDHIIVRDIVSGLFKNAIFWSDFPYNMAKKEKNNRFVEKNKLESFSRNVLPKEKAELIFCYGTQIKAMFPQGVPIIPEVYYYNKEYESK